MKLRKVIFRHFIPGKAIDETKPWHAAITKEIAGGRNIQTRPAENLTEGTNCWSGPESGYFHGWGKENFEGVEDSVAIIEHCTTGHVHLAKPERVRFVQPPENQALSGAIESIVQANLDHLNSFQRSIEKTPAHCTKPHCNCIDVEMEKQGTELIKNYPCLAETDDFDAIKQALK